MAKKTSMGTRLVPVLPVLVETGERAVAQETSLWVSFVRTTDSPTRAGATAVSATRPDGLALPARLGTCHRPRHVAGPGVSAPSARRPAPVYLGFRPVPGGRARRRAGRHDREPTLLHAGGSEPSPAWELGFRLLEPVSEVPGVLAGPVCRASVLPRPRVGPSSPAIAQVAPGHRSPASPVLPRPRVRGSPGRGARLARSVGKRHSPGFGSRSPHAPPGFLRGPLLARKGPDRSQAAGGPRHRP
ncbi:MAG TPA: hypothetical protein VNL16_03510 [Chloroflexota bacterium]|nr:hypothetical protein [Chloroflexota bacterium]